MNKPDEIKTHEHGEEEIASYVRACAVRYNAPDRLIQHFAALAEQEGRESRWWRRRTWQAALAGAMAASLALVAGSLSIDWLTGSKNPYDIVAEEAKTTYRRAMATPRAAGVQRTRLDKLLASFNEQFHYPRTVSLPGADEFVLEGGMLREVAGKKVANLIYRTKNARLLLMVVRAEENPEWPGFLRRDGWMVVNEDSPRTFVWRRGEFIYALVGNISLEQLRQFSLAVSPEQGLSGLGNLGKLLLNADPASE